MNVTVFYRMLVTFGICLNKTLILGIWCSTIPHLPGCFCSWTFCQNIGCNMVPSDLTSCLLHVGPPFGNRFLNTSWAVGLTYRIVYLIFLYFDICNYICLDASYHFWLYLYFLNIIYFFMYSCTITFNRRSICTFYYTHLRIPLIKICANISKESFWVLYSDVVCPTRYVDKLHLALVISECATMLSKFIFCPAARGIVMLRVVKFPYLRQLIRGN